MSVTGARLDTTTTAITTGASGRPLLRRAGSAVAALAVAGALAAAGAPHAGAATRTTRAELPTGAVSSSVVAANGALAVTSKVGPLGELSYVESVLTGKLTMACFAGGRVVSGTGVSAGWVTTGDVDGAPWNNSGYYIDAVAEPAATTTGVRADVVLKNILRDRAGNLAALDCAEGSTAGFYRYRITSVTSARHTFPGAVTGTFSAPQSFTYSFPAPPA